MSATRTGRQALIDQLLADGLRVMFGNPGTVEQGFLDVLSEKPEMRYVLTLHETIAVMAADGYARAAKAPALVQIHSTPGLGNAIGALYQAKRGHSPLVVIGGDAGIRYLAMDAQMAGDLVAMAAPVTKWSTIVADPASLLRVMRRAVKIAATPPMGPVYVCLPMDILDAPNDERVAPACLPSTRVVPEAAFIREAAALLASAARPMCYLGDGVAWSHAQQEATSVAELLGAEVWGVDSGELNFSYAHPLYRGQTGHMFGSHSLPITRSGDVNLVCGTYMVPEVFPELGEIYAAGAKTIHIDLNAYEIAKNHPVEMGVVSDPKLTLAMLAAELAARMSEDQKRAAKLRFERLAAEKAEQLEREMQADRAAHDSEPLHFSRFMEELAPRLPQDVVVFDEALTNSPALTRYATPRAEGTFFQTRGGSLGVGISGAIGVKMARPSQTVLAVAGDGGSLYTIQSLWTAARHRLDIKFVICNNRSYRLLQANIKAYWDERNIPAHEFPTCFDLSKPPVRFDLMAEALGVPAAHIEKPSEIGAAVERAFSKPGPFLFDVVLECDVHPDHIGVRCGQ